MVDTGRIGVREGVPSCARIPRDSLSQPILLVCALTQLALSLAESGRVLGHCVVPPSPCHMRAVLGPPHERLQSLLWGVVHP